MGMGAPERAMLDTLTIRPVLPLDQEPLAAYLAAIAAERLPVLFARATPPTAERVAALITRNLTDERYCLLLAVDDDGVAGMLDFVGGAQPQQRHVGSFGMSVARERRGRGIGARLLRTLFGYAAAHGYRRLELEVFATNTSAIRLYEREGFAHEGRRHGAVMVGEEAVDMLMMGRGV
jgi:ribosomal protein S18 acetylase RimI-like enzyme